MLIRVCFATVLTGLLIAPLAAQDADTTEDPLEGHSGHGEVFNEGPRQAAYLMSDPGSVHIDVTTGSVRAQAFFDQALGQLHGFWYFEAERSFRQVAAIDPDCAMAYWGMAMANFDNPERAPGFAHEAWLRRDGLPDREQRYVDAVARRWNADREELEEGKDEKEDDAKELSDDERRKRRDRQRNESRKSHERFIKDLEAITFRYPDDIEAKALLANELWMGRRSGIPGSNAAAIDALIREVFAVEPMHPAHHYRIHLLDREEYDDFCVDSAQKAGQGWPSVAHQWHMGGHIFARLGRHDDAAWQQEASARVDHAHMIRDRVLPDQIHNFAHNNEWLIRSWRHHGRVRDAIDLARNMVELPRHPRWNRLDKGRCSASFGRRRLFETYEMFELWGELIAECGTMYLEPSGDAGDEAFRAYLLGKAHTHLGDDEGRLTQIARLTELLDAEKIARIATMEAAEAEAIEKELSREDTRDAMTAALEEHESTLGDLRRKVTSLEALAIAIDPEGEPDAIKEALETLGSQSYDPVQLARMYAEADLFEEAEKRAREVAEERAGRVYPHATLAYVLEAAGKRDEALEVFHELRQWSARFDLEVPLFDRLSPLVEAEHLSADWRIEETLADDIMPRIDLDELGPRRWTPPAALAWSCSDQHGEVHAWDDNPSRPKVVILFLGMGCVHCVEQLQAFKPVAEQFAEAGLDLITIGTDSVEELEFSQRDVPEAEAYPFPVLADPSMDVFRAYRAFDDFEGMPLHGTFLIDGDGYVRWLDIGYEPYTDTDFLLAEAQRLLGLPCPTPAPRAADRR